LRHVILISLDTLRADHLGLYGYGRNTSPFLDRLAQESIVFDQALTSVTWTRPAHMTMLTGLHTFQHGVTHAREALALEIPVLAERLRSAGYQTIGLYYEGQIHERHGFARGFDVFRAHHNVKEAGAHLRKALADRNPSQPFFLFLHLFDIHCGPLGPDPGPIYHSPAPYEEMFLPGAADLLPQISQTALWSRYRMTSDVERKALAALYDGGIRYVDDHLAKWIESWREEGILDRSLLILLSDHGEGLGQRGYVMGHGAPFMEGLRIPLIVRHPSGNRAGERETSPAHMIDIVPTVLDWSGLERRDLPGFSLLQPLSAERDLIAFDDRYYEVLIRGEKKWTYYDFAGRREFLRFDLYRDPLELAGEAVSEEEFRRQSVEVREGLRMDYSPPVQAVEATPKEIEKLRALGYASDD